MCVYSMVADHFIDKWQRYVPLDPWFAPNVPTTPITPTAPSLTPEEIADLKALLDRAKKYDTENNEPECELEEKKKN